MMKSVTFLSIVKVDLKSLTADKFRYTNGGRELRIFGLDVTGSGRLIATLSKNNVTNKVKNSIKTNSIIVNKSKLFFIWYWINHIK